jgi:septum formation protein
MAIDLILASSSKIRAKLLSDAGVEFRAIPANLDEEQLKNEIQDKQELALALARAKAQQLAVQNPDAYIIGCDQLCIIGNQLLSKPTNIENAKQQLSLLAGKAHQLLSAVCLWHNNHCLWQTHEIVTLSMKSLSESQIHEYIMQDMPLSSCGSYYFEQNGHHLFNKVEGSRDAILGLPLEPLLVALKGIPGTVQA